MGVFLQVVGGLCLLVALLIVVAVLYARWKIKQAFKNAFEGLDFSDAGHMPARMKLRPARVDWTSEEAVEGITGEMESQGFERVGDFFADGMPVQLRGFTHPELGACAIIYEHAMVERPIVDYWQKYDDGSSLTVTNAPTGDELDPMPNRVKLTHKEHTAGQLHEIFLAERRSSGIAPVGPDGFVHAFCTAYDEFVEWRARRGGSTEAEIRRVAEASGMPVDEETIQQALSQSRLEAEAQMSEILRQDFLESGQITAAEWDEVEGGFLVIHDQMSHDSIRRLIMDMSKDPLDEMELQTPDALSTREAFTLLLERAQRMPPLRKLGTLQEPVPADFYFVDYDSWNDED